MRGFEDSTQPVYLNLDPVVTTALNIAAGTAIPIDGSAAEATDYGILVNVSGVRYFVPWAKVYVIKQQQAAQQQQAQAPVVTQTSAPVVPPHE